MNRIVILLAFAVSVTSAGNWLKDLVCGPEVNAVSGVNGFQALPDAFKSYFKKELDFLSESSLYLKNEASNINWDISDYKKYEAAISQKLVETSKMCYDVNEISRRMRNSEKRSLEEQRKSAAVNEELLSLLRSQIQKEEANTLAQKLMTEEIVALRAELKESKEAQANQNTILTMLKELLISIDQAVVSVKDVLLRIEQSVSVSKFEVFCSIGLQLAVVVIGFAIRRPQFSFSLAGSAVGSFVVPSILNLGLSTTLGYWFALTAYAIILILTIGYLYAIIPAQTVKPVANPQVAQGTESVKLPVGVLGAETNKELTTRRLVAQTSAVMRPVAKSVTLLGGSISREEEEDEDYEEEGVYVLTQAQKEACQQADANRKKALSDSSA